MDGTQDDAAALDLGFGIWDLGQNHLFFSFGNDADTRTQDSYDHSL